MDPAPAVVIEGNVVGGKDVVLDHITAEGKTAYGDCTPNVEDAKQRALRSIGYFSKENMMARGELDANGERSFESRLQEAKLNDKLKPFLGGSLDRAIAMIERTLPSVSWENLVGIEHVKNELMRDTFRPLDRPELYPGTPSKYILLHGPPGTGKTTIAKVFASKIKATFFYVSASSLLDKYVGVSEGATKCIFELARALQPAIIFLDECEGIMGKKAGTSGHTSGTNLLTEFRCQMDGITTNHEDKVFVIAATNYLDQLDPALFRRFETKIKIPLPDREARHLMILRKIRYHANDITKSQLSKLASDTEFFSGSDIAMLCNKAFRYRLDGMDNREFASVDADKPPKLQIHHFYSALGDIIPLAKSNN